MGRSQLAGVEITVAQMAEDARAVLDAERIAKAHVVGHSHFRGDALDAVPAPRLA